MYYLIIMKRERGLEIEQKKSRLQGREHAKFPFQSLPTRKLSPPRQHKQRAARHTCFWGGGGGHKGGEGCRGGIKKQGETHASITPSLLSAPNDASVQNNSI